MTPRDWQILRLVKEAGPLTWDLFREKSGDEATGCMYRLLRAGMIEVAPGVSVRVSQPGIEALARRRPVAEIG